MYFLRSVAEFLAEEVGEGDDLTRLINRLERYQHLFGRVRASIRSLSTGAGCSND
jgi:hypothetical protein